MAKWSNEKVADLTRRLADTAIDYKQRCEELEAKLFTCATDLNIYMNAHAASENKLAKAVEALRQIADPISLAQGNVNSEIAHATLAELETPHD